MVEGTRVVKVEKNRKKASRRELTFQKGETKVKPCILVWVPLKTFSKWNLLLRRGWLWNLCLGIISLFTIILKGTIFIQPDHLIKMVRTI